MIRILTDNIDIGDISSSSGVYTGVNRQTGYSDHSRSGEGFGTIGGSRNRLSGNLQVIVPPWGKEVDRHGRG